MTGKHTPGSLTYQADGCDGHPAVMRTLEGGDSEPIAVGINGCTEADLRQMAAAPDMLEALRACVERMAELQKHTNYPLAWPRTMAYEAIRKATGEPVAKRYRYATDAASGSIESTSLAVAFDLLRSKITDAQRDDGATLWVEDPETGERIVMGQE